MSRDRRGVALVMVLWIVVVLGSISAGVVRSARTSTGIAANARAEVIARAAAESGIEATVAAIEDTLSRLGGTDRIEWLNALGTGNTAYDTGSPLSRGRQVILGEGRFQVVIVDVSSRLDVNAATESALQVFFSQFADAGTAAGISSAIRDHIEPDSSTRDASPGLRPLNVTPIRSLEELRAANLVPDDVLLRAAPYLTVDGDGVINARTASDTVLVAAAGELRDEPSRLLVVSRGWVSGNPLTCEIQAVYAITGNRLVFSHWRERTL